MSKELSMTAGLTEEGYKESQHADLGCSYAAYSLQSIGALMKALQHLH